MIDITDGLAIDLERLVKFKERLLEGSDRMVDDTKIINRKYFSN